MTPSPHHPDTLDVAIIGGGIAGSALAIVLSRAGVRVAVIEREGRFRDRLRGEALMPWGAAIAGTLGIADALPESGAHPLPIWQTYRDRVPSPPYDWREDVPSGDGLWGVSYPGLQESLLRRAADAGALVLRPAKALRPRREADALVLPVMTGGETRLLHTRLVVAADGRESGARAWIGAKTVRDPVLRGIAGCLVAGVDLDPDAAHVGYYPGGAALLFRQASGRSRAYLFTGAEEAERLRGPGAAERISARCAAALPAGALAKVRPVGPAGVFPAADIFADRLAGEGIVLIGDAAGANDPTQGQGLSLALKDVQELSALLLASADWQASIETFAALRPRWYEPLRAHATWEGPLVTDIGPDADAARARADRAKAADPLRGGYGAIHALGPDGLPVTEEARRRYLG
jgi:2-polyprenyl-6-methoxyphenol hydroxylase-like FAD-dependent oxidoreductase